MHHLDGEVEGGALVAVVGPNGAGKSTLFKGVAGVVKPLAGSIERDGLDTHDIAYLPQVPDIDRSFPITSTTWWPWELWRSRGVFGGIGGKDQQIIEGAIAAVVTGFERRAIGTLSGGQMQRMLFARVLVQDARVVLDEPFAAVDAKTSGPSGSDTALAPERRTVLAALHDIELVRVTFRRLCCWPASRGRGATASVLTAEILIKPA